MKFSGICQRDVNSKRENSQLIPLYQKYNLGKYTRGGRGEGEIEFSNKTKIKDMLFSVT